MIDLPYPNAKFHGINFEDPYIKSRLMSLVPFVMAKDIAGIVVTFNEFPAELRTGLLSLLCQATNFLNELSDALESQGILENEEEPEEPDGSVLVEG